MYSRTVNGRTLTFGVSGKLWRNAQVLYDSETGSLWSHITGDALAGPMKGARLTRLVAMPRITWKKWRELYPATKALSVDRKEDVPFDRYAEYRRDQTKKRRFPDPHLDVRAGPKEMLMGAALGAARKAYPLAAFTQTPLIADRWGGKDLLVYHDTVSGATAVYERPRRGGFRIVGDRIVSAKRQWRAATGVSLPGGEPNLKALPHTNAYWFAWAAYYPDTLLYAGMTRPKRQGEEKQ